ncbi:MAG: 3' terminal RNA ribose 2'-O-methyltransferase Hen1 [Phormidesmis sp.]
MLLTITTTHQPATDLGYLLHKHPERCQSFDLSFGKAHVFYPESSPERCTATLLLEVDPVGLVRGKVSSRQAGRLDQYVNDRPYVASSFLSVAIAQVFRTAITGRCKDRPELAAAPIPLTVTIPVLPCRGGEAFLRDLFEPLGYEVTGRSLPLDETFPDWKDSDYIAATLTNMVRLADLLSHLYVLIPVLDNDKHYWIGEEEVEKLLRHGEGWLNEHPHKETIAQRYLKRRRDLTRTALAQFQEDDANLEAQEREDAWQAIAAKKPNNLNQQRLTAVTQVLKRAQAKRVIDLGCGEGNLLRFLIQETPFKKIVGVDVSYASLEKAKKRLRLDELPTHQQGRVKLMQGSLVYRDQRLLGYDAATVVEVIEHLEPERLASLERVLFEFTRPKTVIVTTPNVEYNVLYPMPPGQMRDSDHRFEWTREEFQTWADKMAEKYGYAVEFQGIGDEFADLGTPTQMGIFSQEASV